MSCAWKSRPPGAAVGLSVFASAPNSVTASTLPGNVACRRPSHSAMLRVDGRRARVQVVVPALVVRAADRVDVAVHEPGDGRHVRAPDVDRDRAPRIEAVHELRRRVDVLRPGRRRGRCWRPRWRGSRSARSGAVRACTTSRRTRRSALAAQRRASCAVHAPGESTGPMPCQTRMPAASRRSSSAGFERMLAARRVRADRAAGGGRSRPCRPGAARRRGPAASSCSDAPRRTSGAPLSSRRPPAQRISRRPTFDRQPDSPGTASCAASAAPGGRAPRDSGARCGAGRARVAERPLPSLTGANAQRLRRRGGP